jgi:hypothetical protein
VPADASLMRQVFDQYVRDILPKKKPSMQRESRLCLSQLRLAFDSAPIDAVRPEDIARYRDARSAPVRANREIALLSHVFNMAREWGFTQETIPAVASTRIKRHRGIIMPKPMCGMRFSPPAPRCCATRWTWHSSPGSGRPKCLK